MARWANIKPLSAHPSIQELAMPIQKPGVRLHWKGFESVPRVVAQLSRRRAITLSLPGNFHHALTVRFSPKARLHGMLDITGGFELLEKLAGIAGLHDFADLAGPVAAAGAKVRIRSPAPQVHLFVPESRGKGIQQRVSVIHREPESGARASRVFAST
jgi:hypothetical protein